MRMINRGLLGAVVVTLGSLLAPGAALAQSVVNPPDLGIVEAPVAGSTALPLALVPLPVRHTAQVAFKQYDNGASLVSAQLDRDDLLAVYEIVGRTSDGRALEADIRPDGVLEELEVQVGRGAVPEEVLQALERFAPNFTPAQGQPRIEKSIRPSAIGLSEIWYEFSGVDFDVEVRSDGRAILIEPA